MPFEATCPHCAKTFTAPDHYEGKKGKCSACGQKFLVARAAMAVAPGAEQAADEEAEFYDVTKPAGVPDYDLEESWEEDQSLESPAPVQRPSFERGETPVKPLKRSFATMKAFALIYGVVAVLVVAGTCLAGTLAIANGGTEVGLGLIAGGILTALPMLLIRELIAVVLAIEENTRITAEITRARL